MGTDSRRVDWAGSGCVTFQGSDLPHCGKHFNTLMLPDSLPEDVYEWTMDLRYCWGREREATSHFILKACDVLEDHILSKREALFAHILSLRRDPNPGKVCTELLQSIGIMRRHAEMAERCRWTIKPQDGEIQTATRHCLAILHEMERAQQCRVLTKEQEYQLLGASDSTKIDFVNSFTDSLSDKVQPNRVAGRVFGGLRSTLVRRRP